MMANDPSSPHSGARFFRSVPFVIRNFEFQEETGPSLENHRPKASISGSF